mmetsp:Transcript_54323/g.129115  ORF Transcript_54323/g.129115 Transcript_54323/m.129115 type:complete len:214 (+) Transcript_54323:520-1161(+)
MPSAGTNPPMSAASSSRPCSAQSHATNWKTMGDASEAIISPQRSGPRDRSVMCPRCNSSKRTKKPISPWSIAPAATCATPDLPTGERRSTGAADTTPATSLARSAAPATSSPVQMLSRSVHIASGMRKPSVAAKKRRASQCERLRVSCSHRVLALGTAENARPPTNSPRRGEHCTISATTARPRATASMVERRSTSYATNLPPGLAPPNILSS